MPCARRGSLTATLSLVIRLRRQQQLHLTRQWHRAELAVAGGWPLAVTRETARLAEGERRAEGRAHDDSAVDNVPLAMRDVVLPASCAVDCHQPRWASQAFGTIGETRLYPENAQAVMGYVQTSMMESSTPWLHAQTSTSRSNKCHGGHSANMPACEAAHGAAGQQSAPQVAALAGHDDEGAARQQQRPMVTTEAELHDGGRAQGEGQDRAREGRVRVHMRRQADACRVLVHGQLINLHCSASW